MNINSAFVQRSYASSGNCYAEQMCSQQTGKDRALKNTSDASLMQNGSHSILSNTKSYGETLRAQRQQTKDTSLQLKKLKYQFKNMSAQILRCKTSVAARQVVGQAKREVLRLKREKLTGNYDEEEIEAAITHAKAMERVARKKMKHLEEEELAEDVSADETIQTEEADTASDELFNLEVFDELSQSMQELLEEMGLDELMDSLTFIQDDMDPADLKRMKIRHRNKEMKEIVKADAEYLKAVFDRMEEKRSGLSADTATSFSAAVGISTSDSAPDPVINVVL